MPEPDPVPAPAEAPVQDSGEPASVAVPAEPLAAGGPAEDDSEELTPARVPPTDTEPSDKQSTPGGAAALADALLAPTMGELDEPTDAD